MTGQIGLVWEMIEVSLPNPKSSLLRTAIH
jgi:hypothetical protein